MRYVFISDVHGEYDKMQSALASAGFDKGKDTLVSLGDAMDRGPRNLDTIKFMLGLPNKILLWGNHDARLLLLMRGAELESYDFHNRTTGTIMELAGNPAPDENRFFGFKEYKDALDRLRAGSPAAAILNDYFSQCHMAVEFPDLIGTHAWLPSTALLDSLVLKPSWRSVKAWIRWYDALWSNTEYAVNGKAYPDKKIIVGHWYAWMIAEHEGENRVGFDEYGDRRIDTSIYDNGKATFIDGMSYDEMGKVNAFAIEEKDPPLLYDCASLPKAAK